MIFYGPCTVKHAGRDLGKTFGGVSLSLKTVTRRPVGEYNVEEIIVGGEGAANFYSWPSTLSLNSTTLLYDFNQVILEGPKYKITLYSCKILFDGDSMNFGIEEQKPLKAKLIFKPDAWKNVIKIET